MPIDPVVTLRQARELLINKTTSLVDERTVYLRRAAEFAEARANYEKALDALATEDLPNIDDADAALESANAIEASLRLEKVK